MGANTAGYYYLDTASFGGKCENDFKKINEECNPPKEEDKDKPKHPALKKMLGKNRVEKLEKMANKIKDKYKFESKKENAWMENCDGLWIKPDAANAASEIAEFNSMLKDMYDDIGKAIEEQIKPFIAEATKEAIKDNMVGKGGKAVATKAAKKFLGPVGWVLTGIDAVQAGLAVKDIQSMLDVAEEAKKELKALSDGYENKTPTDMMGDGMGVLSRINSCTRARRCLLVPYRKTGTKSSLDGEGCCPGQTGHHIIPGESGKACTGYKHGSAPTLCVEGVNNGNGTHGKVHDELLKITNKYKEPGLISGAKTTASYEDMRDMGIESVQKTFPESKCDEKCLKAQLDAFYEDKCKNTEMPAEAGKKDDKSSTPHDPSDVSD